VQLERIALRLRRRSSWEALDLGHAMLRAWAAPAYRAWALGYGVLAVVLLTVFWSRQTIALALLWWLKPAFDRVLLFAFSRSLFAQPTTARDLLRALPDLIRNSGLLLGLTLHRFSLVRSLVLPVRQLERLRGKAARDRRRVLTRKIGGSAAWLIFVCANLEIALYASLVITVGALLPQGFEDVISLNDWFFGDLPPEREIVTSLIVVAVHTLVEPLYVAGGFALYLNRRSELEGWDIELSFRNLADRLATGTPKVLAGFALVAMVLGATLAPLQLLAADSEAAPPRSEQASRARRTIDAVLADAEFGHKGEETVWRWRDKPRDSDDDRPGWWDAIARITESIGQILKGLVWIAWIAGAAFLMIVLLRYRDSRLAQRNRRPPQPAFLFGLDVRPESLPEDVAAAARQCVAAGRAVDALSLLYRGALVALIHRDGIDFRPGDTEGDCRRRVAGKIAPTEASFFAELLQTWQHAAYAGATPPAARLERLCADWPRHFAGLDGAHP
jgi:hypothetical protein